MLLGLLKCMTVYISGENKILWQLKSCFSYRVSFQLDKYFERGHSHTRSTGYLSSRLCNDRCHTVESMYVIAYFVKTEQHCWIWESLEIKWCHHSFVQSCEVYCKVFTEQSLSRDRVGLRTLELQTWKWLDHWRRHACTRNWYACTHARICKHTYIHVHNFIPTESNKMTSWTN